MKSRFTDSSPYFKTVNKFLDGSCAACIDNTLHAGTLQYSDAYLKTKKRLRVRTENGIIVSFAGLQIK